MHTQHWEWKSFLGLYWHHPGGVTKALPYHCWSRGRSSGSSFIPSNTTLEQKAECWFTLPCSRQMEVRSIDSPLTAPSGITAAKASGKLYLDAASWGQTFRFPSWPLLTPSQQKKADCYTPVRGENQAPHMDSAGTTVVGEENSPLSLGRM